MPLKKGASRRVIGENIGIEEAHGKKPAQAAAIAYHVARTFKSKKRRASHERDEHDYRE